MSGICDRDAAKLRDVVLDALIGAAYAVGDFVGENVVLVTEVLFVVMVGAMIWSVLA